MRVNSPTATFSMCYHETITAHCIDHMLSNIVQSKFNRTLNPVHITKIKFPNYSNQIEALYQKGCYKKINSFMSITCQKQLRSN